MNTTNKKELPGNQTGADLEKHGKFVISLDFELLYGMNDKSKLERWQRTAAGAREVIPKMLSLFQQYQMHVTWGIVGMLYAHNKEEWKENVPLRIPQYEDKRFSNYEQMENLGENEIEDTLHFAPSLIRQIEATEYQEIASHTFSHYYCMEKGQTKKDFMADIKKSIEVAGRTGKEVKSLIFPKNQFQNAYMDILADQGILAVRGNESGFMYQASEAGESLLKRGVRLLDSFWNLSGYHDYALDKLEILSGVVNIPSSRLFRPYSHKLRILERFKLNRIKGQMHHAAKHGRVFHLWWHPHNFGGNQVENLANLQSILDYYKLLQQRYGMQSASMQEIAEERLQKCI